METINNTHGAELIAQYAKLTGKAFDKSRTEIINIMRQTLNTDVTDTISIAHVGVARLIKEISAELDESKSKNVDNVYTSTALIMAMCAFIQAQHTIYVYDKQIRPELNGAPENVIKKGVLLAATPQIKQRSKEIAQLVHAMISLFMSNAVTDVLEA